MTELSISPLARRIAEENNVEWQSLEGSDAGGGVNERDVLSYLEGVTLGTKPVNPTPEPLPEGMTAWAEELAAPQNVPRGVHQSAVNTMSADNVGGTPSATDTTELVTEESYRELFAELSVLKKAAEAVSEERWEEREAADGARAEAQLELDRVQKTLAGRETELTESRTQLTHLEAEVRTREEKVSSAQLELTRLRETLNTQDEELVEVHALKQQLKTLKAQTLETKTLSERLAKAEAETQKAQAEVDTLKTANAGLERTLADLKAVRLRVAEPEKRPWWKLWG